MLFIMGISFYTSRILLQELGVKDFGIYGIVGGVVALFSSLRGLFSSATQRFLNIELGVGNKKALNEIFNLSIIINIGIAFVFFVVLEVVGMWILQNKLTIPDGRIGAAIWVFHFSVITSVISIITIPFDALIIAHQKMNFYAYNSIFDALIKLAIIFFINFINYDKLILYGFLMLLSTILNSLINQWYCRLKFEECKYRFCWNTARLKELSAFAGWNFAGITAYSLVNEGINICLNMYGGVVLNASRTITYQIRGSIMNFISNINTAVRPHSIELFAQESYERFYRLLFLSSKIIVCIYILLAIPIFVYIREILQLWLGVVPLYSVEFIRMTLIFMLFRSFHSPLDLLFAAVGKLKVYQITEMIILFMPLPCSYISLKLGFPPYLVFFYMAFFELVNLIGILFVAKKVTNLELNLYIYSVVLPILKSILSCILFVFAIIIFPISNILQLIIFSISNLLCLFYLGFTSKERIQISKIVKNIISK